MYECFLSVLEINIQAIQGDLEFDLGIGDIRDRHLIIGCLDSVNARWAINQLAYRAGIPWINGGIVEPLAAINRRRFRHCLLTCGPSWLSG